MVGGWVIWSVDTVEGEVTVVVGDCPSRWEMVVGVMAAGEETGREGTPAGSVADTAVTAAVVEGERVPLLGGWPACWEVASERGMETCLRSVVVEGVVLVVVVR